LRKGCRGDCQEEKTSQPKAELGSVALGSEIGDHGPDPDDKDNGKRERHYAKNGEREAGIQIGKIRRAFKGLTGEKIDADGNDNIYEDRGEKIGKEPKAPSRRNGNGHRPSARRLLYSSSNLASKRALIAAAAAASSEPSVMIRMGVP
jgi:hypothetical protein